mmetsp:Transcript_78764/g.227760  ORF Transcript_78764/g.227760 Transcript_78764/m.227760 type:complete len:209 (-) Transcript_78764:1754-2380(-)
MGKEANSRRRSSPPAAPSARSPSGSSRATHALLCTAAAATTEPTPPEGGESSGLKSNNARLDAPDRLGKDVGSGAAASTDTRHSSSANSRVLVSDMSSPPALGTANRTRPMPAGNTASAMERANEPTVIVCACGASTSTGRTLGAGEEVAPSVSPQAPGKGASKIRETVGGGAPLAATSSEAFAGESSTPKSPTSQEFADAVHLLGAA